MAMTPTPTNIKNSLTVLSCTLLHCLVLGNNMRRAFLRIGESKTKKAAAIATAFYKN